jgi:hypothetical protein
VIQVHVVGARIDGVPRQRFVAGGHLVAVVGDCGELIGKGLLIHDGLHRALGELSVHLDRLEQQPALEEAGRVNRPGG